MLSEWCLPLRTNAVSSHLSNGTCSGARNAGWPTWIVLGHLANGSDLSTKEYCVSSVPWK